MKHSFIQLRNQSCSSQCPKIRFFMQGWNILKKNCSPKKKKKKKKTIARTKFVDYPVVDKTPALTEVL